MTDLEKCVEKISLDIVELQAELARLHEMDVSLLSEMVKDGGVLEILGQALVLINSSEEAISRVRGLIEDLEKST